MPHSTIEEGVRQLLLEMGGNAYLAGMIGRISVAFKETLDGRAIDCEQPAEIPDGVLRSLIDTWELTGMDDTDLHLMIALLRILLINCGRDASTLTVCCAPRERKRIRNAEDGRYRFQLFPISESKPNLRNWLADSSADAV
jgi:hypothetical protein